MCELNKGVFKTIIALWLFVASHLAFSEAHYHPQQDLANDNQAENLQLKWYLGPIIEAKYIDDESEVFHSKGSRKIKEGLIGAITGINLSYHHWQLGWYGVGLLGKARVRLEDTSMNFLQDFNADHYSFYTQILLGYQFKLNSSFSITPGIYTAMEYLQHQSTQSMSWYFLNIDSSTQRTTQFHSGIYQISTWQLTPKLSVSFRTQAGYIYYNDTDVHFDIANFNNMDISNDTLSHKGLYLLGALPVSYQFDYGRVSFIPWISYEYIDKRVSNINTNTTTIGVSLLYLIGN